MKENHTGFARHQEVEKELQPFRHPNGVPSGQVLSFDVPKTRAPPPPPLRTKWTRRVPHPVLIGHVSSLLPY